MLQLRRFLWALSLIVALAAGAPAAQVDLPISPEPGEVVRESRPVVTVQLPTDRSVRYESARFWINGKDASSGVLRTPLFVSFQPLLAMPEGEVEVRFQAKHDDGTVLEREWAFTIRPHSRITSVTHDADDELVEYEELNVEMVAEPGGQAWFEIQDFCDKVPMQEVSEGVYRGTYHVQSGDYRLRAPVVGHLQFGPHESHMEAEERITLFGHLFRVRILEPKSGDTVPLNFTIKGRTRPRARVSIVPKLGFQEGMSAPNRSGDTESVGTIPVEADEHGNFQTNYGVPLKLPNLQAVLTIVATDQEGNRSIPEVLRVKF